MYWILWGKCTTSAECKTIRIDVSAVMDVGMKLLGLKEKLCFTKNVFQMFWKRDTSGTSGNVPGRYGGKCRSDLGHSEMTGKVKWVILTYGFIFQKKTDCKGSFSTNL